MKVRCYHDGFELNSVEYIVRDGAECSVAAARYASEFCDASDTPVNITVVPADEEARNLPGWHVVCGGVVQIWRLFTVAARVEWKAREVDDGGADNG